MATIRGILDLTRKDWSKKDYSGHGYDKRDFEFDKKGDFEKRDFGFEKKGFDI